ncbi:MAG: helix-turn-helix domain-containing protein [Thermoguttaceae bacterium]|nr:helix-turn-helix domain-containing protein [Thermoguttaceae bacterium]
MSKEIKPVDRWGTFNYFFDKIVEQTSLGPKEIAVWLAIFRHGDTNGMATISKKRLLRMTGIGSKHTLNRALARLQELKLIGVVERGVNVKGKGWKCTKWWHRTKRE